MFFIETATLQEIKKQIEDTIGWDELQESLEQERFTSKAQEEVGCSMKFRSGVRLPDHESFEWRWNMGSRIFGISGYYNSWDSNEMDSIKDFYELVEKTKTITVLERKDS